VCLDHLEATPRAEQRAITRARLDEPIGKQEEEITGFQVDRRAGGKSAGGVHAQRKARTFENAFHLAAPVEDVARQVPGVAVDQGARPGMKPAEEEGDKVIRSDIFGEALIDAGEDLTGIRVGEGEGAQVRTGFRDQQGGPNPMATRIADDDPPVAVRHGDKVEVIPAGLLHASEEQYRSLADLIPGVVWTARADGWVNYANQFWYNFTGMTMEQTQGSGWAAMLHPEDAQRAPSHQMLPHRLS
jgi:PAS domain-containing protein